MSHVAEFTFIRLRERAGLPAGSLAPEFGLQGNRAITRVTLGEVFPVLVSSLPSDLRAEYDAWKAAQQSQPTPVSPAPELRVEVDGDGDGMVHDDKPTVGQATSVEELKAMARERGIEGFSTMKKAELIAALEADES